MFEILTIFLFFHTIKAAGFGREKKLSRSCPLKNSEGNLNDFGFFSPWLDDSQNTRIDFWSTLGIGNGSLIGLIAFSLSCLGNLLVRVSLSQPRFSSLAIFSSFFESLSLASSETFFIVFKAKK